MMSTAHCEQQLNEKIISPIITDACKHGKRGLLYFLEQQLSAPQNVFNKHIYPSTPFLLGLDALTCAEGAGRSGLQTTLSPMEGHGEQERCLKTGGKPVLPQSSKRARRSRKATSQTASLLSLESEETTYSEFHLQKNGRKKGYQE